MKILKNSCPSLFKKAEHATGTVEVYTNISKYIILCTYSYMIIVYYIIVRL